MIGHSHHVLLLLRVDTGRGRGAGPSQLTGTESSPRTPSIRGSQARLMQPTLLEMPTPYKGWRHYFPDQCEQVILIKILIPVCIVYKHYTNMGDYSCPK